MPDTSYEWIIVILFCYKLCVRQSLENILKLCSTFNTFSKSQDLPIKHNKFKCFCLFFLTFIHKCKLSPGSTQNLLVPPENIYLFIIFTPLSAIYVQWLNIRGATNVLFFTKDIYVLYFFITILYILLGEKTYYYMWYIPC